MSWAQVREPLVMPALAGRALWCVVGAEYDGVIAKRKQVPGAEQREARTNKSWPRKLREVERFLWEEMRLDRKKRAQL